MTSYFYQTKLISAVHCNRLDFVKVLLEDEEDVNFRNKYCWTALVYACRKGNLEIIKILLEAGADVNFRNKY